MMKTHGIAVGIERINNQFLFCLTAKGKLTHQDYLVITPMLENALKGVEQPEIDALIDATELEGWELQAAWDDFKLGLKHGNEFKKIALVGNKTWQELAVKVGGWFISGELEYFTDKQQAIAWLNGK